MALRRPARGFTLVEALVALAIMATLAALAWQGLDGMLRARDGSQEALDRVMRLNTAVVQWEQDLQAVVDVGAVAPLSFNGQTLLLTRRMPDGVRLVAWSVRGGRWQRWAGPVVVRVGELKEAWQNAQGLLGNEPGHVTAVEPADGWQLYKYIGGNKTNMQSTGNVVPSAAAAADGAASAAATGATASLRETLPDAVEMRLLLEGRILTRVIALGTLGAGS